MTDWSKKDRSQPRNVILFPRPGTPRATLIAKIAHRLVGEGLITPEQLAIAEKQAAASRDDLGRVLVRLGFVTEEQLTRLTGALLGVPYVQLRDYTIDRNVLASVSEKVARRYRLLPLFKIEDVLTVAMADPMDLAALDAVAFGAGCKVEPVIASESNILLAIDHYYGLGVAKARLVGEVAGEMIEIETRRSPEDQEKALGEISQKVEAGDPPIVELVNTVISQAIVEGASDVHLEPKRDHLLVRFRIDGMLYDRRMLAERLILPLVSRIKVMASLDIAKKRSPQDGRIGLIVGKKTFDVRVSTFPTLDGEKVVLRILPQSKGLLGARHLGLSEHDFRTFSEQIRKSSGMVLVTGPTGSGKTTTLYAALYGLKTSDKNIMTIEDPIEYELPGITQAQVNPKAGVTFASALRSILRQDPDVIYVGEIRDHETAEMAVQAALTGHLVLSTLHCTDTIGAYTRLIDLGVNAEHLSSVLQCVMAQRLVRKLCPNCKKEAPPANDLLTRFLLPAETTCYRSEGCDRCVGIGYKGRTAIFEVLPFGRELRRLMAQNAPEENLRTVAKAAGLRSLFENGLRKVIEGLTTFEEVTRVVSEGEQ